MHVWANWVGVGCLALDSINRQRAALLTKAWWERKGRGQPALLTPARIAQREVLWGPLRLWLRGPRVGVGLAALVDLRASDGGATELRALQRVYAGRGYLLRRGAARGAAQVALAPHATGATLLRALLQAAWLDAEATTTAPARLDEGEVRLLARSLEAVDAAWDAFEADLGAAGWPQVAVGLEGEGRKRVVLRDDE